MKHFALSLALPLLAAVTLCAIRANAAPVTWTLRGVTFSDGSTASGSFVYDADNGPNGTYTNVSITVTGPSAGVFTSVNPSSNSTELESVTLVAFPPPVVNVLTLFFQTALTDNGGVVNLLLTSSLDDGCFFVCFSQTSLTGGSVVAPFVNDAFQIRYFSNVTTLGGSLINLSNIGAIDPATAPGTICANIYVFDPNEEELECCSCQITPNALQSISVTALLSQNLTPEKPNSTVVKLLATGLVGTTCDPTTAGSATNPLVPGLRAWATTLHQTGATPNVTYGTETEFSGAGATLSQGELNRLTNTCAFIKANGSGNGLCSVCSTAGGQ